MYNLYVLKDPTTDEVKFVGYTNRPKIRLWEHIRDAKKNVKTHKSNWIRKVLLDGKSPIMEVVKSVSDLEQVKLDRRNKSNSESVRVIDFNGIEYFFNKMRDAVKFTGVNSKQIKKLAYNMKASRKGFMFFL